MEASLARLCAFAGRGAGNAASTGADPLRDEADACLDGMAEVASMEARLAALKVHFAGGYARVAVAMAGPAVSPQERTAQEMAVTAEVACVLTVSERSAAALLAESATLTTKLPLTLSALQVGSISWQHARVMCDETSGLDPAAAAALEAHFLDPEAPFAARGCPAGELVPGRFRAKARRWREVHHPVSIEERHRKGVEERRLEYVPDRDGMAWLSAYLAADVAVGVWSRATEAARALQGPNESRTLTQLRADVAADWLLTGVAEGTPSPKAQVLVTVPVLSLLGAETEPATLDGYGPVPPSMARRLVGDGAGSFLRVLTDPGSGAPLEIGRTSYRVPKAMRQWLRLRDGRCPFPGCNNHSLDNEADHLLAWSKGGGTGVTNLGQPCRRHHRLRHTTAWRPVDATRDQPPGWISPAGRSYPSEQQDWEPPHWPQHLGHADECREPQPPDWLEVLAGPDELAGAVGPGDAGPGATGPGEIGPGDAGPPLPVDPFPDWALFIAA
ncbi:HNH endonuclease signature motif containing protein [Arthrobacter sp. NicSoilC12]|uniref:HNH endonuclease signature motif containing protein n=1 Tax=Arthrobacter sp. NicSoilC12 TaxID=2831001 RepID=UPI001CC4F389|nr:HNH endonuclease signature motif containing protein [Arthrobacter sp. NicSoilC12]